MVAAVACLAGCTSAAGVGSRPAAGAAAGPLGASASPASRPSASPAASPTASPVASPGRLDGAPDGLTGPVARVLAGAPARGPVRVVTTTLDAAGRPAVRVRTVADRSAAVAAVRAARSTSGVRAVAVDHRVRIAATDPPPSNDPLRSQQWPLDRLHAEAARALHGAAGVVVAVVDTGVDATHPDLAGVVEAGTDFVAPPGDGRSDPNGHGTHVAGIIAAVAGNGIGVAGLAAGATILPVRVLDADGSGWSSDVAQGVTYAADHGARVVNLSLASTTDDPTLAAAVNYARSKDVLVVAAAGNDGEPCSATVTTDCGDPVLYPAAYPGVAAVAATDSTDAAASFSETGSFVALAAPGVSVLSTYPGSRYAWMSGTSMASPYVAAAATLVRAENPTWDAPTTLARLVATADDLGAPGRDDVYGAGLVDPVAALSVPASPTPSPTGSLTDSPTAEAPAAPATDTVPPPAPPPAPAPAVPSPSPSPSVSPSPTLSPSPTPLATVVGLWLSATRVVAGGSVVATVGVRDARGAAAPGPVTVCTRAVGARTASCVDRATDGAGRVQVRVAVPVAVDVWASYAGSATARPGRSNTVRVTAVPVVRIAGDRQAVWVVVQPAQRQRVVLQRATGRGWASVAATVVTRSAAFPFTRLAPGRYRLVVPATAQLLGVVTGAVTVR